MYVFFPLPYPPFCSFDSPSSRLLKEIIIVCIFQKKPKTFMYYYISARNNRLKVKMGPQLFHTFLIINTFVIVSENLVST